MVPQVRRVSRAAGDSGPYGKHPQENPQGRPPAVGAPVVAGR